MMTISERLSHIQEQIREHAADRTVTIVAVTKYAPIEQMREAYQAGLRHFGENRVQDALAKMAEFPPEQYPDLQWHLIGALQTNKVKKTVGRLATIQSVDSLKLAEAISSANEAAGLRQPVLIQINLDQLKPDEHNPDPRADSHSDSQSDIRAANAPNRHGMTPDQARAVFNQFLDLKGIDLRGLMTIAPPEASLTGDREALQNVFGTLRRLRDDLSNSAGVSLPDLSMGMTHDFVHALSSGATIIRIGKYLFKT